MRRWRNGVAIVVMTALAGTGLVLSGGPAGAGLTKLPPCDGGTTKNCIVHAKRNGADIPLPTAVEDPYVVDVFRSVDSATGTKSYSLHVTRGGDAQPFTLDPSDVWDVKINTGGAYPWITFQRGKNVEITRGGNETDGYTIRFVMGPVRMATTEDACGHQNNCGGPESKADKLHTGYLEANWDDAQYAEPGYRELLKGFDLATNTDWVSTPLQLDYDTNSIVLDVGNRHYEPDGTTVFQGRAEFRIPFGMLKGLYNVDDPSSLTASAFKTTTGGGSPTTSVTVGTNDVHVMITGLTFTKRQIRITGNTRPRRPGNLTAVRKGNKWGVLKFLESQPRGSKVRGYEGTCERPNHFVRVQAEGSPIVMTNLQPGAGYDCKVRAKSRAGKSPAAKVRMPANP